MILAPILQMTGLTCDALQHAYTSSHAILPDGTIQTGCCDASIGTSIDALLSTSNVLAKGSLLDTLDPLFASDTWKTLMTRSASVLIGHRGQVIYENRRQTHPDAPSYMYGRATGPVAVSYTRKVKSDSLGGDFVGTSTGTYGDLLFDVASVQKSALAIVMMRGVESGLFQLDDYVKDYLGENWVGFELTGHNLVPTSHSNKVTIRHLMTMTSGIEVKQSIGWPTLRNQSKGFSPFDLGAIEQGDYTFGVTNMSVINGVSEPGSTFSYQTRVYATCIRLLEVTSQKDIQSYTKEHLFEPLKMSDTQWVFRNAWWSPYSLTRPWLDTENPYALISTGPDLLKLTSVYTNGGMGIISQDSVEQILTPAIENYGLLTWLPEESDPPTLISAQGAMNSFYMIDTRTNVVAVRLGDSDSGATLGAIKTNIYNPISH